MNDLDFINSTPPTVSYYAKTYHSIDEGITIFEAEYGLTSLSGDNIGGLLIYRYEGKLVAVYDYENFSGWIL